MSLSAPHDNTHDGMPQKKTHSPHLTSPRRTPPRAAPQSHHTASCTPHPRYLPYLPRHPHTQSGRLLAGWLADRQTDTCRATNKQARTSLSTLTHIHYTQFSLPRPSVTHGSLAVSLDSSLCGLACDRRKLHTSSKSLSDGSCSESIITRSRTLDSLLSGATNPLVSPPMCERMLEEVDGEWTDVEGFL
mmetsp:Transcript_28634/g.71447  ORF Transcript_28634/g.71447 Transcript_28634/m.71447 type:complete len:189 (-) Transcript_28634:679-1245(-)